MIRVKIYNEDSEELSDNLISLTKSWDYSAVLLEAKNSYTLGDDIEGSYDVSDISEFLSELDISENAILYIECVDNVAGRDLRPLCKSISQILDRIGMRIVVVIPDNYLNILVGKLYLYCSVGVRMFTKRILYNIKHPNPGDVGERI